MLLLDTHVWIWSADGDIRRVGPKSRLLLLKAEAKEAIRVSPVTLFELTALHTLGRLRLSRPLERWVSESLDAAGVRIAELTPSVAIDAGSIPRTALADPLDRLLVSTARHLDASLLLPIARFSSTRPRRAMSAFTTPVCECEL